MNVHVLIADDHPIVREGLVSLLETDPELTVVGQAGDGLEAVAMAGRLSPDVMIVDLMMPGLNGLEVIRQVHQKQPGIRLVVLSLQKDNAYILQALRNGAIGYLLKDSVPRELIFAIREVMEGRRYISSSVSKQLIDYLVQNPNIIPQDDYEELSNREREVLQMTVEGLSSTEIAGRLSISPRTVETHRANIMQKLKLQNQVDLIRYAIKRGLIPMDDN